MNFFITTFVIAVSLSTAVLSRNTQSIEEIMREGDKYYNEFNHEKALETYLKADSLYPANWVIMWKISRAYVDLGEKLPQETGEEEEEKKAMYDKALFYADSSVKLADNEAEAYVRRAIANGRIALFEGVFSAIGSVNNVKEDCEKAIELGNDGNQTRSLAHYILGRAHYKVCEKPYLLRLPLGLGWGDPEDAIRELEMAVKLRPNFRMYYLALAKAYIEEGEYEKAKEKLLLVEQAPFVDEDDEAVLAESKQLIPKVDAELN
jgi:tetratricopeptide (TPR) repeat protein